MSLRSLPTALIACALVGCAGLGDSALDPDLRAALGPTDGAHAARKALAEGISRLNAGDLEAASSAFNRGLEVEPDDPHLNFLNGYVYELRAEGGQPGLLDLAEIGYRLAVRDDPDHWLAAYHLGVLHARRQRFADARAAFARALTGNPGHAGSAYGLAAASYALGDLESAAAALAEVPRAAARHPLVQRANAIVNAALGEDAAADAALAGYRDRAGPRAARNVARRMAAWRRWRGEAEQIAQADGVSGGYGGAPVAEPTPGAAEPPTPGAAPAPRMVLLDVVLLQQERSSASSHGINLLSALQVQLGATLIDATRNQSIDGRTGAITSHQATARDGWSISVPSVTYALNIANAQNSNSEVVSRPSVLAYDGRESEVFIGSELTYVAGGVNSGRSYNKEVGVSLVARPQFVDDRRLQLEVRTEFTNFVPSAAPGSFDESVATTKSRTRVFAELEVGQTLALAAGRTHRDTDDRGGVPILRDIPIIQYFFSSAARSRSDGALLVLVTPRLPLVSGRDGAPPEHMGHAPGRSPEDAERLRERHRHWFSPTSTALAAMHALAEGDLADEFRRGDLQFAGIESIEAESLDRPRYRQVLDDLVDLLYF